MSSFKHISTSQALVLSLSREEPIYVEECENVEEAESAEEEESAEEKEYPVATVGRYTGIDTRPVISSTPLR